MATQQELVAHAKTRYQSGKGGAATLKRLAQSGAKNIPGFAAASDLAARREYLKARAVVRTLSGAPATAATKKRLGSLQVNPNASAADKQKLVEQAKLRAQQLRSKIRYSGPKTTYGSA